MTRVFLWLALMLAAWLAAVTHTVRVQELDIIDIEEAVGVNNVDDGEKVAQCTHPLCPAWLKERDDSEEIFQKMMEFSSLTTCKTQSIGLIGRGPLIPKIIQLCKDLDSEKTKLLEKDFNAYAPDWLKALDKPMIKFGKLQALAKKKGPEPGVIKCESFITKNGMKLVGSANVDRLQELCLKLVTIAEGGQVDELPQGSGELAACKDELAKLKKQLDGDFSSGRTVDDIMNELKEVQDRKETVDDALDAAAQKLQQAIDKTESIKSVNERMKEQRQLRLDSQSEQKQLKGESSVLRDRERSLMYDAVISGADKGLSEEEDVFKELEEFVLRGEIPQGATDWKERFHKEMNPCLPAMMQKGNRKTFAGWLRQLFFEFILKPHVVDDETFQELIRDALRANPRATRFMTKLGLPSLAEMKGKAYNRLVSIKSRLFDDSSGWKLSAQERAGGHACQ